MQKEFDCRGERELQPVMPTPKWIKVLRGLAVGGLFVLALNCWVAVREGRPEIAHLVPTTMLLAACAHLLFRAPYRTWKSYDWPLALVSVALAAGGGFLFTPEGEERELAFQVFLGVFAGLAVTYGFFCTALDSRHHWRDEVVEPTKRVARFGLIGYDLGLVLAPFAFAAFLGRSLWRRGRVFG